ncbi:universal stress protein [Tissierella creatinini]|nr:universal stress protein [Tissierella creatinini]TJX66673.1 universal stress protein [Soehngenia saccharolytica]
MKKILIAVDGSENSKKALLKAKEIAQLKSSDVYILTVIENLKGNPYTVSQDYQNETTKTNIQRGEEILEEAKEIFKDYPGKVEADYRVGDVADKIIEIAEEKEIDLIVMGRRGLGTLSRAFLGSISNKVLNNVTNSVLIVK